MFSPKINLFQSLFKDIMWFPFYLVLFLALLRFFAGAALGAASTTGAFGAGSAC
jgi:hypothetical protein